jgi:hypothetical protein
MNQSTTLMLGGAVAVALLSTGAAQAQKQMALDSVWCRAGTASVLAKDEKMTVWAIDHLGVAQASDPKDVFHNATQRCVGTIAMFDGKVNASGWCRTVVAKTGDWALVDWKNDDKPGSGTWSYRHGTGALKGITGGGTYQSLGQTRPMETGTYQNCVRVQGKWQVPG